MQPIRRTRPLAIIATLGVGLSGVAASAAADQAFATNAAPPPIVA